MTTVCECVCKCLIQIVPSGSQKREANECLGEFFYDQLNRNIRVICFKSRLMNDAVHCGRLKCVNTSQRLIIYLFGLYVRKLGIHFYSSKPKVVCKYNR